MEKFKQFLKSAAPIAGTALIALVVAVALMAWAARKPIPFITPKATHA